MLWALIIGLFVGIVAKFLMPGKDPGGIIITALLGVAGAAFGHWIGLQTGMYQEGEPVGFFTAVIGAMLILFIYRLVVRRTA